MSKKNKVDSLFIINDNKDDDTTKNIHGQEKENIKKLPKKFKKGW